MIDLQGICASALPCATTALQGRRQARALANVPWRGMETSSTLTPSLRGEPLVSWAVARKRAGRAEPCCCLSAHSSHDFLTSPHARSCFPPTTRARDAYDRESGCAVVPFECNDISTCLDGFENPPTFAQCESPPPASQAPPYPAHPIPQVSRSFRDPANPVLSARASALGTRREAER